MTKQQFLDRMSNAYDMGLCKPITLALTESWCDAVMRLEGGQLRYWVKFLEQEEERLEGFSSYKTLANDKIGYQIIQLLAIMTHHCQKCAVDPEAWHTRGGFCNHKEKEE